MKRFPTAEELVASYWRKLARSKDRRSEKGALRRRWAGEIPKGCRVEFTRE